MPPPPQPLDQAPPLDKRPPCSPKFEVSAPGANLRIYCIKNYYIFFQAIVRWKLSTVTWFNAINNKERYHLCHKALWNAVHTKPVEFYLSNRNVLWETLIQINIIFHWSILEGVFLQVLTEISTSALRTSAVCHEEETVHGIRQVFLPTTDNMI